MIPCGGLVDTSLEGQELVASETRAGWTAAENYLREGLKDEFGTLVTRAQVGAPDVYNEYDRHRAEGELRMSLGLATAIVSIAASLTISGWLLFGLTLSVILTCSGVRRNYDAEMKIWDLLISGTVQSPTLEVLRTITLPAAGPPILYSSI